MNELHKHFNSFQNYKRINNIKTINDNAGIKPVKVSKDLFKLLEASKNMDEKYSDRNDISFGRVIGIWKYYMNLNNDLETYMDKENRFPTIEELEEANKHTDINNIILNKKDMTGSWIKNRCRCHCKRLCSRNSVRWVNRKRDKICNDKCWT